MPVDRGLPVRPGLQGRIELTVDVLDTAVALRSGDVAVLATPRVVALCEEASIAAVAGILRDSDTTVGMRVQLDHVAPIAVGQNVCAEATLEKVQGRRLTFTVSVNDARGLVAAGKVTRVVVDRERFLDSAH